jgi:rubrerythrin
MDTLIATILDFREFSGKLLDNTPRTGKSHQRSNAMEKMDAYREKLEAQLKDWKAKIEMLEEKAAKATGETKTELLRAIGELRQKKEAVKEKWTRLQKESGAAWDKMREGLDKAAVELKNALDKVVSRFK